jgi:predicted dinucleotide-binding enzyme
MNIGMLGTGQVGRQLATALVAAGHPVRMGSRTASHEGATAWAAGVGEGASHGTFADAAAFGEVVFNATPGEHSLAVLKAAGAENLAGKVLIDVSNPLDFSRGFPPRLFVSDDESLAERIQAALPEARVVKALNTVSNEIMVDPAQLGEPTHLPICGNDAEAKAVVTALLQGAFGWERILDLGDLSNARGTEAWLLLWTRLYRALGTGNFNMKLVTKEGR